MRLAMEAKGWRGADLADAIGVDRATPHAWLWADRKPDLEKAVVIERVLGIQVELWTVPPEKPIDPPGAPVSRRKPSSRVKASELVRSGNANHR